jgi:hypothetical protein
MSRLLHCLCGLSLVFLIPVVVLWVRSHVVFDRILYTSPVGSDYFAFTRSDSYPGYVSVMVDRYRFHPDDRAAMIERACAGRTIASFAWQASRYADRAEYESLRNRRNRGWFAYSGKRDRGMWEIDSLTFVRHSVCIPYWSLALPLSLCPIAGTWRGLRLRRRLRRGQCPRCGYDLRGSTESGRCPECGMVASSEAANDPNQRSEPVAESV